MIGNLAKNGIMVFGTMKEKSRVPAQVTVGGIYEKNRHWQRWQKLKKINIARRGKGYIYYGMIGKYLIDIERENPAALTADIEFISQVTPTMLQQGLANEDFQRGRIEVPVLQIISTGQIRTVSIGVQVDIRPRCIEVNCNGIALVGEPLCRKHHRENIIERN